MYQRKEKRKLENKTKNSLFLVLCLMPLLEKELSVYSIFIQEILETMTTVHETESRFFTSLYYSNNYQQHYLKCVSNQCFPSTLPFSFLISFF